MPKFIVPTEASIHTSRSFLSKNTFFEGDDSIASLEFNTNYLHLDPMALSMIAAWGAWCKRKGLNIEVNNFSKNTDYAARMKLFHQLDMEYDREITEHEEIGRFLPLQNIKNQKDINSILADVSALLHLDAKPDSLATIQYCMSELLRNVLEHSGSPDGAFVCAQNYSGKGPHRVTLAIADCGCGITQHLGKSFPEILDDDLEAIRLSMLPGITGATAGEYGTPDNAGAGLFITRCIAKGTGGYFEVISGNAAYRLFRAKTEQQSILFQDAFHERSNQWKFPSFWQGTVVSIEINTEMINDFESFFGWIKEQIPPRTSTKKRIRFT